MAEIVIMPKLGFNMSAGRLVKWNKKEGELVNKGESFFEIETDKTTIGIDATTTGTVLKLLIKEGEEVPVTTPIAIVGQEGENIENILKDLNSTKEEKDDESKGVEEKTYDEIDEAKRKKENDFIGSEKIKLTPRARRYLKDNDIDFEIVKDIKGTGFDGGITEKDILKYLENNRVLITPLAKKLAESEGIELKDVKGSGYKGKILKKDVEGILEKGSGVQGESIDSKEILEIVPYEGVRKIIGTRLSASMFTAPHIYFTVSVDMTKINEMRKEINDCQDNKITVTDLLVLAVGKALEKYPMVNASLVDDKIIKYKSINIGVAVAANSGLIVPVVKNVQDKKISEVVDELHALINKAKEGKLLPDEYSGGTFTISNLGMFNIDEFTAIINPPESAILAVSSVRKTPVVVSEGGEEKIVIKPIMKMTLSVDHRIIDGLLATQFINEIKASLEKPISILL